MDGCFYAPKSPCKQHDGHDCRDGPYEVVNGIQHACEAAEYGQTNNADQQQQVSVVVRLISDGSERIHIPMHRLKTAISIDEMTINSVRLCGLTIR